MSVHESPYLKTEQRLADVIAAIQAMASNEACERESEGWADVISGDRSKGSYWRAIFDDHGELFRSTEKNGSANRQKFYSLIARRALPHFNKITNQVVYYEVYKRLTASMSPEEKRETFNRPQLSDTQIKVLLDIAVSLHTKAFDGRRDWRWWIAPAAAFLASLLSAMFAFMAAWQFRK
ncbi:MAG: hypothetical protein ACREDT_02605 [Methylocella sp.]